MGLRSDKQDVHSYLYNHQRIDENDIRRRARNESSQRGVITREGEIRKWKAEREREEREAAAAEQKSVQGET
jgi:negative regulator of sigma E activity